MKRVSLSISESLLAELDAFAHMDRRKRDELLEEAVTRYIADRKRLHVREEMRKGYQEMAAINLQLASEGMDGAMPVSGERED